MDRHRDSLGLTGHRARVVADAVASRAVTAPVFRYHPLPDGLAGTIATFADEVATHAGVLVALVATAAAMDAQQVQVHQRRDPASVTAFGRRWYGSPDRDLVEAPHTVLADAEDDQDDNESPGDVDAIAAADHIREVMAGFGLDEWTVDLVPDMAARMSVSAITSTVRVRSDAVFSHEAMRGLIVHEVGTHVLRAANGARQPFDLLRVGTPGYLETEEGLATWHEGLVRRNDARSRTFALRVIANDVALTAGFAASRRSRTTPKHTPS